MHIVRTLRVTIREFDIIKHACAALDLPRANLIQEGVTEAAHRMGIFAAPETPPRPTRAKWPDAPDRGGEAAHARFATSFSPEVYDLLKRASTAVGVSEAVFAVGATLRYVATLKRKHTPNRPLQAVQLPAKYRH